MPRRNNKKAGGSRKTRTNAFNQANRQGIGETQDWIVNDIQAVVAPQSINPGFYTVRLALDANGYSWTLSDSGTLVASYPSNSYFLRYQPYGTENGQFDRLALLWNQYRTDWISVEYQPVAGSGQYAPTSIFKVVDETGNLCGSGPQGDLIPKVSSYRNVSMVTPYKQAKMTFNYAKWLGQTNPTAWLQTQANGSTQVIREQYVTPLNDPAFPSAAPQNGPPAIVLVFGINVATSVSSVLGTLRVRAKYTFRQRNMLTGAPFFELEAKDGSRMLKGAEAEEQDEESNSNGQVLTKSVISQLLGQRVTIT